MGFLSVHSHGFVPQRVDNFDGKIVLITGVGGALGSAVANAFLKAGATVCGSDIVEPNTEDFLLSDPERVASTGRTSATRTTSPEPLTSVVDEHGRLDYLPNIAGTWRGGTPVHETDADTFDFLFDVNLKTMFLASKHAIPHLRETEGAVVTVSARSSLEGGAGDGVYRASKAGVRLLTETIAAENLGSVRANAVMPSVIALR